MIALIALGACATSIETKQALDAGLRKKLQITEVTVDTLPGVYASSILAPHLRNAVLSELSKIGARGETGKLELVITKAIMIPPKRRAWVGAFAGSDILYVSATVKNARTNSVSGQYEIKGEYNPGGYGMFSVPEEYTSEKVAETLVKEIYQLQ